MSEVDFEIVCSKIDDEKYFLNTVSQEIWKMPELKFKEVQAHALLTCALKKKGFKVEKHYFMPTAFRAEFSSKSDSKPAIAIILEYDALPEIGHACGHNLIAESGLAAALGIKATMENDPSLKGKVVVLGTPAEEGGGGKIQLLELGAFDGIDAALMVHPHRFNITSPVVLNNASYSLVYKGREAHAAGSPWDGINALDAAVSCYQSLAFLKQHIKPTSRIQAIITKGGVVTNVIPSESCLRVQLRATTRHELHELQTKVEACFTSAAAATGCEVHFSRDDNNLYEDLITNRVMGNLFNHYAEKLGMQSENGHVAREPVGSTDLGNVSHSVPCIHPLYSIHPEATNHTTEFTQAAGSPQAQSPTLAAAKAMALTALKLMRCSETLQRVKHTFKEDVSEN